VTFDAMRVIRLALRISQCQLAQLAGVAAWRISYAERGILPLRVDDQRRIAAVFVQYVSIDLAKIFPDICEGPATGGLAPQDLDTVAWRSHEA